MEFRWCTMGFVLILEKENCRPLGPAVYDSILKNFYLRNVKPTLSVKKD